MITQALKALSLRYFRNLSSVELVPSAGLNLFLGQNGHGKTNLLESIALTCGLKPLRSVRQNQEFIQHGQTSAYIRSRFCNPEHLAVDIEVTEGGKKVQLNQKSIREARAVAQHLALVTFVPDDLQIVTGSASLRRKAVDQLTASLFPSYFATFREYERALLERNRLLKSWPLDTKVLASFTQVLAQAGAYLLHARMQALKLWHPYFLEASTLVPRVSSDISWQYCPSHALDLEMSAEQMKIELLKHFETNKREEIQRKTTLVGPHLDDILFSFGSHPARQLASRGQARALVLAFKLAQLQTIANHRQLTPLFLLDDVVGELDQDHAERLLVAVKSLGVQTFLTTTHLETLPEQFRSGSVFYLNNGHIGTH